ncbi:pumilio homolog 9-like [Hordeum vulgare subsp. vulgare]|uniref:PUM-HD domain-containing protein n=1 Tax=Hordeum vulgare subsp. vulgare TaxID=112509 RepID=A0A8I7B8Z4_HORVV|nr:pumilio homolog 9-like [Hordeum vulgare subsp. vulgare]
MAAELRLAPALAEEERRLCEEEELLFEDIATEVGRLGLRESEVEAQGRRQGDAAAAGGILPLPVVLERPRQQRPPLAVTRLMSLVAQEVGPVPPPPPPPPGMPGGRRVLDEWYFPGDHLSRGRAPVPQNFRAAGSVPPRAAWLGDAYARSRAFPGSAASTVEDIVLFLAKNEQVVLGTLFWGTPEEADTVAEVIVQHAVPLIESSHGTRLLVVILNRCNHMLQEAIVARITRDHKKFFKICAARSSEVVSMINSCLSERSLELLRDAIIPWVTPLMMARLVTDSSRLMVVHALVQRVPHPYFAEFIFAAVATNCLALAIHPHGVSLLQSCLEHVEWTEKDNILSKVSCCSTDLAQNRFGNYIVQYVLKQRNPSYLAIIASRFRSNYVRLSKQRYSSNVVETCLEVFNDRDRSDIVHELICYRRFRDLVSDEFANYVISRALTTCKVPLRDRLATAILSLQNVNRRHPHCLKMFNTLSELGYRY